MLSQKEIVDAVTHLVTNHNYINESEYTTKIDEYVTRINKLGDRLVPNFILLAEENESIRKTCSNQIDEIDALKLKYSADWNNAPRDATHYSICYKWHTADTTPTNIIHTEIRPAVQQGKHYISDIGVKVKVMLIDRVNIAGTFYDVVVIDYEDPELTRQHQVVEYGTFIRNFKFYK